MADAILVIDMQVGMLEGAPKHDLAGVVERINRLTDMVRRSAGAVIWIRHCGPTGSGFERDSKGWAFLPELTRRDDDRVVEKTLNDAFARTTLAGTLKEVAPERLLVAGWATDFCVDTTIRSAVSKGFKLAVASDAHTLADRPHLDAKRIIKHHNWVWAGLIADRPVRVATTTELLAETR